MPPTPLTWNGTNPDGTPLRWDQPGLVWGGNVPEPPNKPKKMPQLRVQLSFSNAPDHSVEERATSVLGGLYTSPLWAPLPTAPDFPTEAQLTASRDAFTEAISAASMGGPADTAAKNNARDALIAILRKLAGYVQDHHDNDLAKLLASGFEAVSTNRASVPLPKPVIREILLAHSGELKVRVEPIPNAKNYEPQYALIGPGGTPGPWVGAGLFSASQQLLLTGLTPGAEYAIRVRAIGGSTGYSDWSDVQSHRVM